MSKVISFTGENLGLATTVVESEVTLDRLQAILDAAVITVEPDNEGLYVSEGTTMPLWVHVQPEHKLIALVTYHETAVVEAAVGAAAANRLNGTLILVQFHYREGRLWAHSWLNYSEGLSSRSFIRMMRLFAEIASSARHEERMLFHNTEPIQ
jgi:hypothetical protein